MCKVEGYLANNPTEKMVILAKFILVYIHEEKIRLFQKAQVFMNTNLVLLYFQELFPGCAGNIVSV